MKFAEAIEMLKNGRSIRRKKWRNNTYTIASIKLAERGELEVKCGSGETKIQSELPVTYADFIADDWEVIALPKDYKIFVSQQGELYINGEKISNNCSYTLEDYMNDSKAKIQTPRGRAVMISLSFIVNVDERAFGR